MEQPINLDQLAYNRLIVLLNYPDISLDNKATAIERKLESLEKDRLIPEEDDW